MDNLSTLWDREIVLRLLIFQEGLPLVEVLTPAMKSYRIFTLIFSQDFAYNFHIFFS